MEDVIGVAASAAGGGVFGLLGTVMGRIAGFLERRQSIAHEERRWRHEIDLLQLQQAVAVQEAEAELAATEAEGSWSGLTASLAAEAAIGPSYKWVNAMRALTRPLLTLLLWVITIVIWFTADLSERATLTETATFAATAATLWWFGDRSRISRP